MGFSNMGFSDMEVSKIEFSNTEFSHNEIFEHAVSMNPSLPGGRRGTTRRSNEEERKSTRTVPIDQNGPIFPQCGKKLAKSSRSAGRNGPNRPFLPACAGRSGPNLPALREEFHFSPARNDFWASLKISKFH